MSLDIIPGLGALIAQVEALAVAVAGAVSFITTQTLTIANKALALTNISAGAYVSNFTALQAFGQGQVATVYVGGRLTIGDGYQGYYYWSAIDQTANVAADTMGAIFVPPSSSLTGRDGCWVRQYDGELNVSWFGVLNDGRGNGAGTNNTPTLQAAINLAGALGGATVAITKPGKYVFNTTVNLTVSNVAIRRGYGVVFDWYNLAWGSIGIYARGSYSTTITNLSVAAVRGDTVINLATPHGLNPGDWFLLMSQQNCLGTVVVDQWKLGIGTGNSGTAYFAEFLQVQSATAYQIVIQGAIEFPTYDIVPDDGTTRVSTIKKVNWLEGFSLTGGTDLLDSPLSNTGAHRNLATFGIRVDLALNPKVRDTFGNLYELPGSAVWAYACFLGDFKTKALHTPGWTKDKYWSPAIDHSQFNSFKAVSLFNCKWEYLDINGSQGLDCTYGSGNQSVTPYFPGFNIEVIPNAQNPNETGFTTHPGYYRGWIHDGSLIGCQDTGLYLRSRGFIVSDMQIIDAKAFGSADDGAACILSEGYGVDLIISNVHMEGYTYGFKHNRSTSGGEGPVTINTQLKNIETRYCGQSVRIRNSSTVGFDQSTNLPSGLIIDGLVASYCYDDVIYLESYVNDVDISNVHIDVATGTSSSNGLYLEGDLVGCKVSNFYGLNVGTTSYLVNNSQLLTDRTTFPANLYPTQGHSFQWSTIKIDPSGAGRLALINNGFFNQPSGSYSITRVDVSTTILSKSGTACTYTLPLDSTSYFPVGAICTVIQQGAGQITFAGESGVTISSTQNRRLSLPNIPVNIMKQAANSFLLSGGLTFPVSGENPITTQFINSLWTPPSSTERGYLNTYVQGLVDAGIMAALDYIWLLGWNSIGDQGTLLNLKNPGQSLVVQGGVTRTSKGWVGDGQTTSYLDVQAHFDAAGNNFQLNSLMVAAWCNVQGSGSGLQTHIGVASGSALYYCQGGTSGNETFTAGDATANIARPTTGRTGSRMSVRTGPTTKTAYYGGSVANAYTTPATAVASGNGALLKASTDQLMLAAAGGGLNTTQAGLYQSLATTFFTAIGTLP